MPLFPRKDRRYRVIYDLHAWLGVIAGLFLYVMFFAGAISLFREPLLVWDEPAHQQVASGDALIWTETLFDLAPADAGRLTVVFPDPDAGLLAPTGRIRGDDGTTPLIWTNGGWAPRQSDVADFIYHLHYLHFDWASWLYYVGGVVSLLMMVAIVTGLGIHLRDLLPQLERYRPSMPSRVSWADLHKVTAVLALPFQLIYAFTGVLFVLGTYLLILVGFPLFGGDVDRGRELVFGPPLPEIASEHVVQETASPAMLLDAAAAAAPGMTPRYVDLREPGWSDSSIRIGGTFGDEDHYTMVWLSAADARLLRVERPESLPETRKILNWLFGLHLTRGFSLMLRGVYAALALLSCATLLTGLGLWLTRRARGGQRVGDQILQRLTVGVGAGLPVAIAAMLLASRLLPWALTGRTVWLEVTFFATLAATCAWASFTADHRRTWAARRCGRFAIGEIRQYVVR